MLINIGATELKTYLLILALTSILLLLFLFALRFFFIFGIIRNNLKNKKKEEKILVSERNAQRFSFFIWIGISNMLYWTFFIFLIQTLSYLIKIKSIYIYLLFGSISILFYSYVEIKKMPRSIGNLNYTKLTPTFYFWPKVYWENPFYRRIDKILKFLIIILTIISLLSMGSLAISSKINKNKEDIYFGGNLSISGSATDETTKTDCFNYQFVYLDVYNGFDYSLKNVSYSINSNWIYRGNISLMPGKNRVRFYIKYPISGRNTYIKLDSNEIIKETNENNNQYVIDLKNNQTDLSIESIERNKNFNTLEINILRNPIISDCPNFNIAEVYINDIKQKNIIFTGFKGLRGTIKLINKINISEPHKIKVILDPNNLLKELNELNNELTQAF